jgi:hypothetical protein
LTGQCRKLERHMLDGSHAHVGQPRHCLLQLPDSSGGGIEHLLLHGLLDGLVHEAGSSTANLAASNQSIWIFFGKGQILVKVDSDILTLSLVALRGILALQSSMATLFSSLEKCLLVFAHMAVIDWQMQSGFLHYIHCQNSISLSRMMKIGVEHPNKQENKMQLSPGS